MFKKTRRDNEKSSENDMWYYGIGNSRFKQKFVYHCSLRLKFKINKVETMNEM